MTCNELFEACGGREREMGLFCEDAVRVWGGFDGVGGTGALLIDPRKNEGQRMNLKQQLQLIGQLG